MKRIASMAAGLLVAAGAHGGMLQMSGIGGDFAVPVKSLRELRFASTLRQQYDFSCGSAAVATLLTHQYGYPVSEETVFAAMYARGDKKKIRKEGFSMFDMKQYLESIGFHADGFQQPLSKLATARLPAIVLISDHGYHHFVIIKGMRDGRVLLGDPASGTRAMPRAAFESIWVNHLLFVIHDKQGKARFNDEADWNVAPRSPLASVIRNGDLDDLMAPRFGGADF